MAVFELSNNQRKYFGLDPIEPHWEKVVLKGYSNGSDHILYYDNQTIKKDIFSKEGRYFECQYNELTRDRAILLPKTTKGKEKKLTESTLGQRKPIGVYLSISEGNLVIGNYDTQTTFYSSNWEVFNMHIAKDIQQIVEGFIRDSSKSHLAEIAEYKSKKRRIVKYKPGDYFSFKINRSEYGYGRLLLDINSIRKKGLVGKRHGFNNLMGPPLLIQLFAYKSNFKKIDISILNDQPRLPADIMMDNCLIYGEYEIIGHKELEEGEFEFPISYGHSLDSRPVVFLHWGLIYIELPIEVFSKYLIGEIKHLPNPYSFSGIGFRPHYNSVDVVKSISNKGVFDFETSDHYTAKYDLRNPINSAIRDEILIAFGLNPQLSYIENCKLTNTIKTTDLLKLI